MTTETKALVARMLHSYLALSNSREPDAVWREAIDAALAYCDTYQPAQGRLLRVKYICGLSDAETMLQMKVSRTTYQKHKEAALSTVLECAARRGLL